MTALSYQALRDYLTHKDPNRRLVITPILDPSEQLKSTQAGIDVRLGRSFSLVRAWTHGVAETLERGRVAMAYEPQLEATILDLGQPLIIHPHQFVLARTLEIVRLPENLLAYVIGRSSWGRRGLTVATAVVVHPGFAGPVTLELKNVGEIPIALYPMDRIAQLTFHEVGAIASGEGAPPSQFSSTFSPVLGRVRDPATDRRIRKLVEAREKQFKKA